MFVFERQVAMARLRPDEIGDFARHPDLRKDASKRSLIWGVTSQTESTGGFATLVRRWVSRLGIVH